MGNSRETSFVIALTEKSAQLTCLVKWRRAIPPSFFHTWSRLSSPPFLPYCCLHLRAKAIPVPARSENSATCQTSHSDTPSLPFFYLRQPPASSSHRLSWKVALFYCARSCILTLLYPSPSQSYQTEVAEVFKMDYFSPHLNHVMSHPGYNSFLCRK